MGRRIGAEPFPGDRGRWEIVRARLAATRGIPGAVAAATVIADITIGTFAQILFTLSGLYLLARVAWHDGMTIRAAVGGAVAVSLIAAFYTVQHFGIFRLTIAVFEKLLPTKAMAALAPHGEAMDRELRALYARRRAAWVSFFWSIINWATGVGEVWIALTAMGVGGGGLAASFERAWILESMQEGVRAAVFLIPGGLGVQEGSYLVIGNLLGIPADAALALALIRRVRELAFGVPGLLAWQWVEGARLLRRRMPGTTR